MREKIDKNKLTIPIYLNTKIVFDMLATIEDGFQKVKTEKKMLKPILE